MKLVFIGISCLLFLPYLAFSQVSEQADITVIVQDTNGDFVSGAMVGITFRDLITGKFIHKTALTDQKGSVVLSGPVEYAPTCVVEKFRYYKTQIHLIKTWREDEHGDTVFEDKVLRVVLKKQLDPIPMLAKRIDLSEVTGLKPNTRVGFDFLEGAFTKPLGNGNRADVYFTVKTDRVGLSAGDFTETLIVEFNSDDDGIIPFEAPFRDGSELRSDYLAPESGYLKVWSYDRSRNGDGPVVSNTADTRCYYFRIRTELDEEGNVKSANFGKIYGELNNFVYYVNPNSGSADRNIEFDRQNNLLGVSYRDRIATP